MKHQFGKSLCRLVSLLNSGQSGRCVKESDEVIVALKYL